MKKQKFTYSFSSLMVVVLLTFTSCQAIFETDISDHRIEVVSPVDKAVTGNDNVTFLWRKVEEARNYQVTVVSPSFKQAGRVITDTIVGDSITQFSINMSPGDYQWSIRAFNSGYSTTEQRYTLKIE